MRYHCVKDRLGGLYMENAIITVDDVTKEFKSNCALNHVSVCFERGKIHGIIGRNGSGKTVLFKCICGLMHPDSGRIMVRGKLIGKDIDMPEHIGSIIEAPGFLPNYSGIKNLQFLADINHFIDKIRIEESMRIVGLNPHEKKHVGKYSLGMRQRLGLAQAIMENPDILILDEPMNGLDNDGVAEIRALLKELNAKGTTVLLASHNKADIDILCDTVIEMDRGTVITVESFS